MCVSEEAARILDLKPGHVIDWNIWNRNLRTRVACIERTESIRMSGRFEFLFSPGQLDGLPAVYYGSARVRPGGRAPRCSAWSTASSPPSRWSTSPT